MSDVGVHVDRLESLLADLVMGAHLPVPGAVRKVAAAFPVAHALDLAFALGTVAAGLDQPGVIDDERDAGLIAALYRAHVSLVADITVLMARDPTRAGCRDLLQLWRELDDRYFV